ncbi:MAG: DUF3568 family protein [Smithellaceae bacterium]|jgi:hypothetical protein
MLKKIIGGACLYFAVNIIGGCTVLPIIPVVGTVYDGYVGWKGHQATKYYAEDIGTIRRAVVKSSQQLHLKIVRKPADTKGHSLELKCKEPLQIEILPFEKRVTKVMIKINLLGDKQFADFFYQRIDANIAKVRRG